MLVRKVVNISFLLLGILSSIGVYIGIVPVYIFGIIGAIWIGITVYGVLNMSMEYFMESKRSNPVVKTKGIAITFDDGPNENTLQILDILEQYQAKATFFCIGKQIEKFPEIALKIIAKGHVIGNHTYSHDHLIDVYGTSKISTEIRNADAVIKKVTGQTPKFFRPPYGITNPNIARAIQGTGHDVIGWNKRSFDTVLTSQNLILKKIKKNVKRGDVVLLHDTKEITIVVLEQLLLFLQQKNFRTLTIDELFEIHPYA